MTGTVWDSGSIQGLVSLTGSNLTATLTSGTGSVHAVKYNSSGLYYFEITKTTAGGTNTGFGVAISTATYNATAVPNAFMVYKAGTIYGGVSGTYSGWSVGAGTAGDVYCFAVNMTTGKAWVRKGAAGPWNGPVANGDPVAGTNGVTIGPSSASLFAQFDASSAGITLNSGDSAFSGSVPSGYTSGWPAAASYTLTAANGSVALTGEPASPQVGHKLVSAYGAFSETGFVSNAALVEPIVVFGAFSETGEPATLRRSRIATFSYGSFSLTGEPATLTYASGLRFLTLTAAYGSFAETGELAGSLRGRRFPAAYGAFSEAGEVATLVYASSGAHILTAAYGSFALTGEAASLRVPAKMDAFPAGFGLIGFASTPALVEPVSFGSFALSGQTATLGVKVSCSFGSFALTGKTSLRRFAAPLEPGAFALSGFTATAALVEPIAGFGSFTLTGRPLWRGMVSFCLGGSVGLHGKTSFRKFGGLSSRGALALTGETARLARGKRLAVSAGAYAETGESAAILHNRTMELMAGSVSLSGQSSGINIKRLGGVSGTCAILWAPFARTSVKWIS